MMRACVVWIWLWAALAPGGDAAAADPIRVALVAPPTLEAARGAQGLRLGLDDATGGTRKVRGRPIELVRIEEPDDAAAATLLDAAYRDGKADLAVSLGGSAATLALLPVAAERQRILLVAEAPADAIAGRTVFRSAASTAQMAAAAALAVAQPEMNLFVVAEETRDGRDAIVDFKAALTRRPSGAFFIGTRLLPPGEADVGAAVSADYDSLHGLHEAKTLLTFWSGMQSPIDALAATHPGDFGIKLALAGDLDPNARLPGIAFDGITAYFHTLPRNHVNDRLVAAWRRRTHAYPDGFAANGMSAALALVAALRAAPGTETPMLVAALEGLRFETPKGSMVMRAEDHQAQQVIYQFRSTPTVKAGAPALVHAFTGAELSAP